MATDFLPTTPAPPWGSVSCSALPRPHAIALCGEIDIALEKALEAALSFLTHSRPSDIAVCLHDVTFLDSTALDFLVRVQQHATASGTGLCLVAPSSTVRWVLRIAGLADAFGVEDATSPAATGCACRVPRVDGVVALTVGQRVAADDTGNPGTVGLAC